MWGITCDDETIFEFAAKTNKSSVSVSKYKRNIKCLFTNAIYDWFYLSANNKFGNLKLGYLT